MKRRTLVYAAAPATLDHLDAVKPMPCPRCEAPVHYAWFGSTVRPIDAEPVDQGDASVIVLGEHQCPAT